MGDQVDRLTSLPDDIIHKILSFISLKHVVQTCVLSSRWRFIWTSMPFLNFSSEDFSELNKFSNFVTHFLSCRNNMTEVFSVCLTFSYNVKYATFINIVDYALSHNIQELNVHGLQHYFELPRSLFSSRSLKHLRLTKEIEYYSPDERPCLVYVLPPTSSWELPALTTLYLFCVTLRDCNQYTDEFISLFPKCANLKNLTLVKCKMDYMKKISISHPWLSNLKLESEDGCVKVVNVVTPQLKNLTIKRHLGEYVIIAPNLASLLYEGWEPSSLFTEGFHSLEKADLSVQTDLDPHVIVYVFQQLHNVKFLTLNMGFVEQISASIEVISRQPSPFANLKRLKIHPGNVSRLEKPNEKVTISADVKNYFLDSSPNATFAMVTHKEIRSFWNATSANKLMGDLQVMLEQYKADLDTNTTHMELWKAPTESHTAKMSDQPETTEQQWHFGGMMTQVERYWKILNEQVVKGKENTARIVSLSRKIEELLTNVPPSQRADLQSRFLSLCAEADVTMKKIIYHTNIQFD